MRNSPQAHAGKAFAKAAKLALAAIFCVPLLSTTSAIAADTSYQYDSLGRVIKVTSPDSKQICYAYDAAGNRTQVKRQATGTCTVTGSTLTAAASSAMMATAQQSAANLSATQAAQNQAVAATPSTDEPAAGF